MHQGVGPALLIHYRRRDPLGQSLPLGQITPARRGKDRGSNLTPDLSQFIAHLPDPLGQFWMIVTGCGGPHQLRHEGTQVKIAGHRNIGSIGEPDDVGVPPAA